ncbi:unnamed protein product [Nesidiocoris tenuis]|uniref:Uncharacterized protein n=1 Tax=Nesidiocoris tenuis TaxID=355587 RepID=A0A6H5GQX2_9HEMI|nr:unnamed protein product [Nesidiocoris tenuis]
MPVQDSPRLVPDGVQQNHPILNSSVANCWSRGAASKGGALPQRPSKASEKAPGNLSQASPARLLQSLCNCNTYISTFKSLLWSCCKPDNLLLKLRHLCSPTPSDLERNTKSGLPDRMTSNTARARRRTVRDWRRTMLNRVRCSGRELAAATSARIQPAMPVLAKAGNAAEIHGALVPPTLGEASSVPAEKRANCGNATC